MGEKQSVFAKLKQKINLKNKNIVLVVGICLVCGIVLLFSFPKTSENTTDSQLQQSQNYTFDALEYASQVSSTLERIINNIKGVSNAKVVVIVNQSPKVEYLTETDSNKTAVAYFKNGSTYQPVVITQFLPQISGILIVAKGAGDLQIKNNLLNAVSAVYNVNISCIDILEGK